MSISRRRRRVLERQPPEETIPNKIEEPDEFEVVEGDALDNVFEDEADELIAIEPADPSATKYVALTTGACNVFIVI